MKLIMIRHGETIGNRQHRYVGSTDEGLLEESKRALSTQRKSWIQNGLDFSKGKLFSSPLQRCRETANVLFPNQEIQIVNDFRECDFGDFEYKNYRELDGNKDYQRYIDSNGESGFPRGESRKVFQQRSVKAFETLMKEVTNFNQTIIFVVHGGTIMALCDYYSKPHRDYFDWQIKNGKGFQMQVRKQLDNQKQYCFEEIKEI